MQIPIPFPPAAAAAAGGVVVAAAAPALAADAPVVATAAAADYPAGAGAGAAPAYAAAATAAAATAPAGSDHTAQLRGCPMHPQAAGLWAWAPPLVPRMSHLQHPLQMGRSTRRACRAAGPTALGSTNF